MKQWDISDPQLDRKQCECVDTVAKFTTMMALRDTMEPMGTYCPGVGDTFYVKVFTKDQFRNPCVEGGADVQAHLHCIDHPERMKIGTHISMTEEDLGDGTYLATVTDIEMSGMFEIIVSVGGFRVSGW